MSSRIWHRISLALLLVPLGCGTTASGVPSLTADSITAPNFPGVQPRVISLVVKDKRSPAVDDDGATVANVYGALSASLTQAGFTLGEKAPHELLLMIESAKQGMGTFAKESCIQIHSILHVQSLGPTEAIGSGCFEYRHLLGFRLSGAPTLAYEAAINFVLQRFDQQLNSVAKH